TYVLYEHIKHMLWTTIPASVIAIIVYLIAGLNTTGASEAESESMTAMLSTLNEMFNWNLLLLIPPIIIFFGALRKYPTFPVIFFLFIVSAIFSMFLQVFYFKDFFA